MTKTGSRSRTVSDRKHNNISFQRKENRLLEPNQQKFVPNKEEAPRAKRSRTVYTNKSPGHRDEWSLTVYPKQFFLKQNRLSGDERSRTTDTNKNILFQTKSAPGAEWNTNKPKQKGPTKMKYMYEQH